MIDSRLLRTILLAALILIGAYVAVGLVITLLDHV